MDEKVSRIVLDSGDWVDGAAKAEAASERLGSSLDQLANKIANVSATEVQTSRAVAQSGSAWERYRRQLDPVLAAQDKVEKIVRAGMRELEAGRITQEEFNRTTDQARAKYLGLNQAADAATQVLQRQQQAWDQLRSSMDPYFAATQAFQRAQAQATEAVKAGIATQEQANAVIDQARGKYLGGADAATAAAKANEQLSASWKSTRASLDPAFAAQQNMARVQAEATAAVKAGIATQAEANTVLDAARARFVALTPAEKAAAEATQSVRNAFQGLAGQVPIVGGLLTTTNVTALAATAGVVLLAKAWHDAVAEYAKAEQAQLRLEAVLKATGYSAGISAKDLADYADQVASTTLTTAEDVKRAAGVLASFDAVSGETFKKTLGLAQDFAAVFGGDMASAAQTFGRALEDPLRGMDSLRRSIGSLNPAQRELIRNFVETGDVASAQAVLLRALEDRIGGAGAAEAGGVNGAVHRLAKSWGDLQEMLGGELAGPTVKALNLLSEALDLVTKNADKIEEALGKLAKFGSSFLPGLGLVTGPGQINEYILKPLEKQLGINTFTSSMFPSWLSNFDPFDRKLYEAVLGPKPTPPANLGSLAALAQSGYGGTDQGGSQATQQQMAAEMRAADQLVLSLDNVARAHDQLTHQQQLLQRAMQDVYDELDQGKIGFDDAAAQIKKYSDALDQIGVKLKNTISPLEQFRQSQAEALELAGLTGAARAAKQQEFTTKHYYEDHNLEFTPKVAADARSFGADVYNTNQATETSRQNQQLAIQAAGLLKVADAYKISDEAAEHARLHMQAEIDMRDQGNAAIETRYQYLLKVSDAEKASDAAKLLYGLDRQIEQQKELNAAMLVSVEAYQRVAAGIEAVSKGLKVGTADYDAFIKKQVDLNREAAIGSLQQTTIDLKAQNDLLQLQIGLLGQPPELIAKATAALQAQQYALKNNLDVNSQAVQNYKDQLEQNALLQQQMQRAQQEQQMWLEPFKNAVKSIQDVWTDLWRQIFDGGIKSFKDLGKQLLNIFKELAVQIAVLLTFRPVIGGFLSSIGLGNLGQQLGVISPGGSTGGLGLSGILGGSSNPVAGTSNLGTNKLFGTTGSNGGLGSFLNQPISGIFSAGPGAGLSGPASGIANAAGAVGDTSWFGNLSIGQGLGAIFGVGSGILQLTQGNTIGGISSIIGAGVSLIPGIGQIAGPIIAVAGSILGSLLKKKPPHANAQLLTAPLGTLTSGPNTPFQGTDFTYSGPFGLLGYAGAGTNTRFDDPDGAAGDLLHAINEIDKAVASLLSDSQIAAVTTALQKTPALKTDFKKFDNEGFDIELDRLQTEFKALYGSNVAKTAFDDIERGNDHIQDLAQRATDVINFANAIDQLGKSTSDAEAAVKQINSQFDQLKTQAIQYGFGQDTLDTIAANRQDTIDQLAKDFNDQTARNALAITDPNQLAMNDLLADQEKRRENALYLNTVSNTLIDINALEQEFGLERENLVKQQLGQLTQSFRDFFDQLMLGPASMLSPQDQLAQALGRYNDVRDALVSSNYTDQQAIADFQAAASNALTLERQVYASSQATAQLYDEIVSITRILGDIPGHAAGTPSTSGLFIAGERGPELIYSAANVGVLNSAMTMRLLGAANTNGLTDQGMRGIFAESNHMLATVFQNSLAEVATLIEALRDEMRNRNQQELVAANARRASGRAGRRAA